MTRWTGRAWGAGAARALALAAVAAVLVGGVFAFDIGSTWVQHRSVIVALADSVPDTTAYMRWSAAEGHPLRLRRWTPLDSLPTLAVCAVALAENANFFIQGTFDWDAQRMLASRIIHGDFSRGASGISQQLARNLFLGPDRTFRRKAREYVLAIAIARSLSKERQLELYLNLVQWGDGVWGIAAGSERLFHRPVGELTPSETILLALVLPAPSRGLALPLSRPRRAKLDNLTRGLWREGLFDDLTRSATLARLGRTGDHFGAGMSPTAAAHATSEEMGLEWSAELAFDDLGPEWQDRCNLARRGDL